MGVEFSKDAVKLKVNQKAASHWTVPNDSDKQSDTSSLSGAYSDTSTDRAYHSYQSCPYVLPCDIKEGQRQNLHHHLIKTLYNGNNCAGVTLEALEKGIKVLDVGFGSGIWLAEMHRDFPKGNYFGVDITISTFAETFRDLAQPGKINLVEGNVYERLPFDDNSFDYVHQQELNSGIPERLWPSVIAELLRVLKPGGVLDLSEIVPIALAHGKPDSAVNDFNGKIQLMMKARGVNLHFPEKLPALIRSFPGFDEGIIASRRSAPVGWDGSIGHLWLVDAKKGYLAVSDFICASLGMSKDEWLEFLEKLADRWTDSKTFFNLFRVVVRKRF
ncbi:S-adenosyl-L-methionine-dependent methyltransferase [Cladochytrium replicatum]|nr:S-adenosyl-L-methionine-dependent methyltransferase [Cladochytrium replicatum]